MVNLEAEATPRELKETLRIEEALENRNFSCEVYDKCLFYASQERWASFTCKNCLNFK